MTKKTSITLKQEDEYVIQILELYRLVLLGELSHAKAMFNEWMEDLQFAQVMDRDMIALAHRIAEVNADFQIDDLTDNDGNEESTK